jgi:gamma-glutamylcyclotransferase (GGCT)/AIG2-like uncharacterized protein YtfP
MWPFKKQHTNGLTEWAKEHEPSGFTYDMWKLQRYAHQPLFVYDQCMQAHRMHSMIDEWSEFRGTAFTANDNWILWKKRLGQGTFPIPVRIPHPATPMGRIKGELYLIDSKRFKALDEYKQNGVEFRRKPVEVLVACRHLERVVNAEHNYEWQANDRIVKIHSWMYVGRYTYWKDFLDAGVEKYDEVTRFFGRCQIHSPNSLIIPGKYYSFSELEYND